MSIETYLNSSTPLAQYAMHPLSPGFYDGTVSENSSPRSPISCIQHYDQVYPNNAYFGMPQFPYIYQEAEYLQKPMEPISLEVNIDDLYNESDRRRKKNPKDKNVSSQVHSRRRAQNRASQRAFRDRKEKHVKELEQKLGSLEEKHSTLAQDHEALQQEYESTKKQLARVQRENETLRDPTSKTVNQDLTRNGSFDPGKRGSDTEGLLFNDTGYYSMKP